MAAGAVPLLVTAWRTHNYFVKTCACDALQALGYHNDGNVRGSVEAVKYSFTHDTRWPLIIG